LLVTDTPGIKSFVFGTDALAEVRGASALLDRLNRRETTEQLHRHLAGGGTCDAVFANGGIGQFILEAPDREAVEKALKALAAFYRSQTGGEVRIVWGLVPWPEGTSYPKAVQEAHFQMRLVRETAANNRSSPQIPLLLECGSTSHLPARTQPFPWGGESLLLSAAAGYKREERWQAVESGPWGGWMKHLAQTGPWPDRKHWRDLRAREAVVLNDARRRDRAPARKGYVGLVYADGNAMGRLVQELDDPSTCTTFSELVDGSISEACFQALDTIFATEIGERRVDPDTIRELPADILLLGGDDLLVLLPADDALRYTLQLTRLFEEITRRRIEALPPGETRTFFEKRLGPGQGLTASCGVALAPAKYPCYLLIDLAEDLLRSAKQGGSRDPDTKKARDAGKHWAPSYIDFHLVVGPAGADLEVVREEDYLVESVPRRTLRPYRRERLEKLREAVSLLKQARLPRSKLQELLEAALDPRRARAELHARELFGRLRQDRVHQERQALWLALNHLGMTGDFPWVADQTATALADLVEACDLFPPEETP
jgi:hypothetical protein